MILSVSMRTDIPAFYSEWFINRYHEGFVDVRNPFNKNLVSRIFFKDVDLILFCSKNPLPILPYLKEITQPILFHITITGYKEDIESNIHNKKEIIDSVKEISKIIGKQNTIVRYDPIFISNQYSIEYHIKAFKKLCELLTGYIDKIIISFIDNYKNVRKNKNKLQIKEFTEEDYKIIGTEFSKIAHSNGIKVHTCFEDRNLVEYGLDKGECLSHDLAFKLTGKTNFKNWTARKEKKCNCVQMVDIGEYNTCSNFCFYCYANYDEEKVLKNKEKHDPKSSLLIGYLSNSDIIKIREK